MEPAHLQRDDQQGSSAEAGNEQSWPACEEGGRVARNTSTSAEATVLSNSTAAADSAVPAEPA